ncbi:MAG: hypothetical protein KatS3mg029_0038 [Saprospiraceae bacterium]|nr:MAG: hypothetical protein KatS3mg029_0038 [Saprospiraceae bacterium]
MRPSLSVQAFTGELVHFFFPTYCVACERSMPANGELLCVHCRATLPSARSTPVERECIHGAILGPRTYSGWCGHVRLHQSQPGSAPTPPAQIRGQKGNWPCLGRLLRPGIEALPTLQGVELIVPVPLHERKLWMRGYNQSACFASGLSERWECQQSTTP